MKNQLISKIFALADLLIEKGRPMSVRELSEQSGIERSCCWRIVSDLCELGMLRRSSYRSVEPGLGMVFLGQAAYSDAFFPRRALEALSRTARELDVRTALGGIFKHRLVYLHRDGSDIATFRCPLHGSNIALCILTCKSGGDEAFRLLSEDAGKAEYPPEKLARQLDGIERRIRHMERFGYALEEEGNCCNISFPVERNGEIFGLAFFFEKNSGRKIPELIIRCSQLRNVLQEE